MVRVTCDAKNPKDSEMEVDSDLMFFEQYVKSRRLGPELDRHERAIIKTYLYWKMWGAKGEADRVQPDGPDLGDDGGVGLRF